MPKFEGINEIALNHDTMKKAVEHYLNNEVFYSDAAIKIKDVKYVPTTGQFEIQFEAAPDDQLLTESH